MGPRVRRFSGGKPSSRRILAGYQRSAAQSSPVIATVSGPPGIGKSRLGREVLTRITSEAQASRMAVVRSESFGRGHPLGLAADVVRALLGVAKGTTLEATRAQLIALCPPQASEDGAPRESSRELLARFIANEALPEGLDPRGARDELWLAMTDFVVQVANREPSVLVLEDMQWADADSIDWVDHLLGRAAGRPLYVLALVRPEFFRSSDKTTRFAGRDHLRLDLRPLSRRSARGIAKAMLGHEADEQVLDRIAAQAAGSPLFAEELSRLTALGRDTHAAPTIEAAIQVSLDALEESSRDAVERLSVFGLSGWDQGSARWGSPRRATALRAGRRRSLIEQAESRLAGAREWASSVPWCVTWPTPRSTRCTSGASCARRAFGSRRWAKTPRRSPSISKSGKAGGSRGSLGTRGAARLVDQCAQRSRPNGRSRADACGGQTHDVRAGPLARRSMDPSRSARGRSRNGAARDARRDVRRGEPGTYRRVARALRPRSRCRLRHRRAPVGHP